MRQVFSSILFIQTSTVLQIIVLEYISVSNVFLYAKKRMCIYYIGPTKPIFVNNAVTKGEENDDEF